MISVRLVVVSVSVIKVLDKEEYERWIISAKQTLESARSDLNSGFYNWACFKLQQAAEFAVYGIG